MIIRILSIIILTVVLGFVFELSAQEEHKVLSAKQKNVSGPLIPSPTIIPDKKVLKNDYHIFQSFNNCGPASLSMVLSYYGIQKSQEELGQSLRPWQNPEGIQDDKSVTLAEMANKGKEYGLIPYHRPNGNIKLLQQFVAADIPILTRTWLQANEDIGHYRIIKGYDNTLGTVLQDDSFQDKNLTYTNEEFNEIWEKFNYEYIVFVPKEKQHIAESILGQNVDQKYAWEQAKKNSLTAIEKDPDNIYNYFNLSVAYYNLGDYKKSVEAYEKIEFQLPFRTLWYQIEPVMAYYKLGQHDQVLAIADSILSGENSAYSELYLLRGNIYKKQGNKDAAKVEYELALQYNQNLTAAKEALDAI